LFLTGNKKRTFLGFQRETRREKNRKCKFANGLTKKKKKGGEKRITLKGGWGWKGTTVKSKKKIGGRVFRKINASKRRKNTAWVVGNRQACISKAEKKKEKQHHQRSPPRKVPFTERAGFRKPGSIRGSWKKGKGKRNAAKFTRGKKKRGGEGCRIWEKREKGYVLWASQRKRANRLKV